MFFAFNSFAQGSKTVNPSSFKTYVSVLRLASNLDSIKKSSAKTISLPRLKNVYRNEYLTILKIPVSLLGDEKDYAIEDELILVAPNGALKVLEPRTRRAGTLQRDVLAWSREMIFDDSFQLGEYRFVYRCINLKTGVERVAISSVLLADWQHSSLSGIVDKKEYLGAIKNYHKNQSPESLLRIFNSEHCKIFGKGNSSVDHKTFIFLREAFRQKPFLSDILARDFELASNVKRQNTIILLSALGDAKKLDGKIMTTQENALRANVFQTMFSLVSPYEGKSFVGYTDSLWGEFFAKGNFTPIEHLAMFFDKVDSVKNFVNALKSGKKPTDFQAQELRTPLLALSSYYSIMRNTDVNLAIKYIEFYVKEHEISAEKIKASFAIVNDYLSAMASKKVAQKDDAN